MTENSYEETQTCDPYTVESGDAISSSKPVERH